MTVERQNVLCLLDADLEQTSGGRDEIFLHPVEVREAEGQALAVLDTLYSELPSVKSSFSHLEKLLAPAYLPVLQKLSVVQHRVFDSEELEHFGLVLHLRKRLSRIDDSKHRVVMRRDDERCQSFGHEEETVDRITFLVDILILRDELWLQT